MLSGARRRSLPGRALAVLAVAALFGGPAAARSVTGEERAALVRALDTFTAAMRDGDEVRVVAALPPRMVAWIARQHAIDDETERQSIVKQLETVRAAGVRETAIFDLDGAAFDSLKDGTPYAVIPTHGEVTGQRHMTIRTHTLALMEDGRWYLLALGTPVRLERLRQAFPEFDGAPVDETPTEVGP